MNGNLHIMAAQSEEGYGKRPHVLIMNSCRAAVHALGKGGEPVDWYLPTVVSSLSQAAELLRQSHFDVVASDVTSDGGEGLALPSMLLDLKDSGAISAMPSVLWRSAPDDEGLDAHARLARRAGMSVEVVNSFDNSVAKRFIRRAAASSNDDDGFMSLADSALDEQDLVQALLSGSDVRLVVQPRIELGTGKIVGALATARWTHRDHGDIPGSLIFALANESGLNVLLFHRMGSQVVALLRTLMRIDCAVPIAVGVSAATLCTDDFAQRLEQRLACAGVDKSLFALELIADAPVPDVLALSTAMSILRLHGFSVLLGAFGRGGTTLDLLAQLPFSGLKIDHLLVQEMRASPAHSTVVKAAIQLGHDLGMRVVAGGVDRPEDVPELIAGGCDAAQGTAFFPALEVDDFVALVSGSPSSKPS